MKTKEEILLNIYKENCTEIIYKFQKVVNHDLIYKAMQQYAEEYHRSELLKLNKSDVISSVCNHRFVRTTKNYKPAKKCVECGYVLQTDL